MENLHKRYHYGFRCHFCGSTTAYLTEHIVHCRKMLTATLDLDNPEKGICVQAQEEPESNLEGTRNYNQLACAGCGAVWSSPWTAFNTGSMYLERVTHKEAGIEFVENTLTGEQQEGLDIYTDYWGDAVRCSGCGWMGIVTPGAVICPCCRKSNMFTFQNEVKHRAYCAHACYRVVDDYPREVEASDESEGA